MRGKRRIAAAITVLTVAGTGSLLGGTPVTAAAFNEASNNNALAFRGIVGAIELAGPIAARACLASPACVKGLRFFGAMAVVLGLVAMATGGLALARDSRSADRTNA